MIERLRRCLHTLHHVAHFGERPIHGIYFIVVAYEAHGPYGLVAGVCAVITFLTLRDSAS